MRLHRESEELIKIIYDDEEIENTDEFECIIRLKGKQAMIMFPFADKKETVFECLDAKDFEVFAEQIIETLCAATLSFELDSASLYDIFSGIEIGAFFSKEIDYSDIKEEIEIIIGKIHSSQTVLVRIEGNIYLLDYNSTLDEIQKGMDDCAIEGNFSYTEKYKSNCARLSIWYEKLFS